MTGLVQEVRDLIEKIANLGEAAAIKAKIATSLESASADEIFAAIDVCAGKGNVEVLTVLLSEKALATLKTSRQTAESKSGNTNPCFLVTQKAIVTTAQPFFEALRTIFEREKLLSTEEYRTLEEAYWEMEASSYREKSSAPKPEAASGASPGDAKDFPKSPAAQDGGQASTVKFFNVAKSFGFITPDGGGHEGGVPESKATLASSSPVSPSVALPSVASLSAPESKHPEKKAEDLLFLNLGERGEETIRSFRNSSGFALQESQLLQLMQILRDAIVKPNVMIFYEVLGFLYARYLHKLPSIIEEVCIEQDQSFDEPRDGTKFGDIQRETSPDKTSESKDTKNTDSNGKGRPDQKGKKTFSYKGTLLHLAVQVGNPTMVALLRYYGVKTEDRFTHNQDSMDLPQQTALEIAETLGFTKICGILQRPQESIVLIDTPVKYSSNVSKFKPENNLQANSKGEKLGAEAATLQRFSKLPGGRSNKDKVTDEAQKVLAIAVNSKNRILQTRAMALLINLFTDHGRPRYGWYLALVAVVKNPGISDDWMTSFENKQDNDLLFYKNIQSLSKTLQKPHSDVQVNLLYYALCVGEGAIPADTKKFYKEKMTKDMERKAQGKLIDPDITQLKFAEKLKLATESYEKSPLAAEHKAKAEQKAKAEAEQDALNKAKLQKQAAQVRSQVVSSASALADRGFSGLTASAGSSAQSAVAVSHDVASPASSPDPESQEIAWHFDPPSP